MEDSGRWSEEASSDARFAQQLCELGIAFKEEDSAIAASGDPVTLVTSKLKSAGLERTAVPPTNNSTTTANATLAYLLPPGVRNGESGSQLEGVPFDSAEDIVVQNARLKDRIRQLEHALQSSIKSRNQDQENHAQLALAQENQCRAHEESYQRGLTSAEERVRDAEDQIVKRIQQVTSQHIKSITALEDSLASLRHQKELESETMNVSYGKLLAELALCGRDRDQAMEAAIEAREVMKEAEIRWEVERKLFEEDRDEWREREAELLTQVANAQKLGDAIAGAFGTAEVETAALLSEATRVLHEVNGGGAQKSSKGERLSSISEADRGTAKKHPGDSKISDDMNLALAIAGVASIPDPREVTLELMRQKLHTAERSLAAKKISWARREKALLDKIARKELPSFMPLPENTDSNAAPVNENLQPVKSSVKDAVEISQQSKSQQSVQEKAQPDKIEEEPEPQHLEESHKTKKKAKKVSKQKKTTGKRFTRWEDSSSSSESEDSDTSSVGSRSMYAYSSIQEVHSGEGSGDCTDWTQSVYSDEGYSLKNRGLVGMTHNRRHRTQQKSTKVTRTRKRHRKIKSKPSRQLKRNERGQLYGDNRYTGSAMGISSNWQDTTDSKACMDSDNDSSEMRLSPQSPAQTRRLRRIYEQSYSTSRDRASHSGLHSNPSRKYYREEPSIDSLSLEASSLAFDHHGSGKKKLRGAKRSRKRTPRRSKGAMAR